MIFSRENEEESSEILEKVLIVGVDSKIGSALKKHFKKSYITFGTTRKKEKKSEDTYYFDLEHPNFDFLPKKIRAAVICASSTDIKEFKKNSEKYRRINVTNTIKLVEKLSDDGCFIIYLSSNAVFDGKKPFYKVGDETNPVTLYGKFKAEVEKFLTSNSNINSCILRLTKVITEKTEFLERWKNEARVGVSIKTYKNRYLSPIDIKDVVEAIDLCLRKKQTGIFHLGGSKEITYTDYAYEYFKNYVEARDLIKSELEPGVSGFTHNSLSTELPK